MDGTSHTGEPKATVVLVRHGQSEWNALRRWQGTADSPLTALGRSQARDQASALRGIDWAGPWSSPLRRAAETAEILADELGLGPVRTDGRLREAFAGEWEGLTPDEIDVGWPGWRVANRRPPAFEPDGDVQIRAWAAIEDIADQLTAAQTDATALVATHSGLMRRVAELHGFPDIGVPNLGGYRLDLVAVPEGPRRWSVDRLTRFDPADDAPSAFE